MRFLEAIWVAATLALSLLVLSQLGMIALVLALGMGVAKASFLALCALTWFFLGKLLAAAW